MYVNVVGVLDDSHNFGFPGCAEGPPSIRLWGNLNRWPGAYDPGHDVWFSGWESPIQVRDHGDLMTAAALPEQRQAELAYEFSVLMDNYDGPWVVLGGNHSITGWELLTLKDHYDEPTLVVHLDAHSDMWADASYLGHDNWVRWAADRGCISRVVQAGIRNYQGDPLELVDFPCEVQRVPLDYDSIVRGILDKRQSRMWLTIDLDVVDPAYAPGVSSPEPGGPTSQQIIQLVYRLATNWNLAGADIVELNPQRDPTQITSLLAHRLYLTLLAGWATHAANATAPG